MNFGRVVRMAIRYKFTFAASILSALVVAVLWGANIGAVYPVVEVVFKNKSMQQWIDEKIVENRATVAAKTAELEQSAAAAGRRENSGDDPAAVRNSTGHPQRRGRTRNEPATVLRASELAKPYIDAYLPADPFQTLVFITVFLLMGTVLKDLFLVANNVLVARLAQLATFDLRKLFYRRTLRMDLATFSEDGTADLMSRFTNDMNQVASGLDSLFGKLIREPLEDVRLPGAGGVLQLAAAVAHVVHHSRGGLLHPLAGQDAQAGQPPRDGRNGRHLHHPRRNLPQHQDRQGLHHRIARTQAIPRQQQELLPQGDAHRPLRFAEPSDDRSAGHRHGFAGDDRRRMADLLAGAGGAGDEPRQAGASARAPC